MMQQVQRPFCAAVFQIVLGIPALRRRPKLCLRGVLQCKRHSYVTNAHVLGLEYLLRTVSRNSGEGDGDRLHAAVKRCQLGAADARCEEILRLEDATEG